MSYGYQWIRSDNGADSAIHDATKSTYELGSAYGGKAVKLRGTFTGEASNEETMTSAATGAVASSASGTLKASLLAAAKCHKGKPFTFELRFSEGPP